MVAGVYWLLSVRSAEAQCFRTVTVPPVHLGAFYILENKLIGITDGV